MNQVKIDDTIYSVPGNWDELSLEQQQIAAAVILPKLPAFFMDDQDLVSEELFSQLKLLCLQLLLNLKEAAFFKLPAEHVHIMVNDIKVVDFLFYERGPLNLLNRRHRGLLGPGEKLHGISAIEWFVASKFYDYFIQSKNETMFLAFLSCFYREEKNGVRKKFDLKTVDKREKIVAKMPESQKLLTSKWYEANRVRLSKSFPEAFENSGEDGDFMEMMLQLAKDGPFGNMEETQHTEIELVMMEINRVSKEIKQLKSKSK